MKKIIYALLTLLLVSCISSGYLNRSIYQKADRIVYIKIFGEKSEITDKAQVLQILDVLGGAKKGSAEFMAGEQLLFIQGNDTLTIYKNGASLKDAYGTYCLGPDMVKELDDLLKK